jgi:hypothetical protein
MDSKYRLITKLNKWIDEKSWTNHLNLINSSLEIVYCNVTLSNLNIIKLATIVSIWDGSCGMDFIHI